MAEKLQSENTDQITKADLRRVVDEIKRQKELASEYAGNAASSTKNACERYGLEKTALTFVRRLDAMEETKRSAVIRNLIDYADKLGHLDQFDAFDDLIGIMEAIVERARGRNARKPDETLKGLIN